MALQRRTAAGRALTALALLAPVLAAGPGEAQQAPPPDHAEPVAALDDAGVAVVRGDWQAAAEAIAAARSGFGAWPSPEEPPGAGLETHLADAEEAVGQRDAPAARAALARARGAATHAGIAQALATLAAGEGPELGYLAATLDLDRADPDLPALLAALEETAPGEAAVRATRDRVAQRLWDRVAEAARVETLLARLAMEEGLPGEAGARGAAAATLAEAMAPQVARLPSDLRGAWSRMLADLVDAVGSSDAGAMRALDGDLRPFLLSLGLGRTITPLDAAAMHVHDAARAAEVAALAHRAAPSADGQRLRDAASVHLRGSLAEHRGTLFAQGNGTLAPLEANVTLLASRLEEAASAAALAGTVEAIRDDLRRIAHLTFGAFGKLEYVNVPQGGEVRFALQAGRFPLEGVRSWMAEIAFDPSVATMEAASTREFALVNASWNNETGTLQLRGATPGEPVRRQALLAHLVFQGVGEPGSRTFLTFERFVMERGDGGPVEVFLLREGRVQVAESRPGTSGGGTAGDEEDYLAPTNPALKSREAPAGAAALAMGAMALAAAALPGAPRRRLTRAAGRCRCGCPRPGRRGPPRRSAAR